MAKGSVLIPSVRYKDAKAGMAWLERALGFVTTALYEGPEDTVAHAQMTFGESGMIMLGSASNANPVGHLVAIPSEVGGRVTSPIYLVVEDCEPVYAKAETAGAEVVQPLRTMEYGGKAFTLRDPEGYLWSVGEYDPWKEPI
jgi:uncharacterized glyoxalase superfamily protein PhnB